MNQYKKIFSVLLFFSANLYAPTPQEPKKPVEFDKTIYKWSKPLSEAFSLMHKEHVNESDPEKPMVEMIKTFVKSFDPHSYFLDQKGYDDILQSTKGELSGGIGILIDNTKEPDDDFLKIIDTIPTGPADKAGLKADDKIIEIDGEAVKGMAVDEAVSKLKGKRGTQVHIKVLRSDTVRMLPFTLTRDIVKEPNALCYHIKDHNVIYLCLTMFTENSVKQLEQVFKKIKDYKSKALIIDLRNNSGGLLDAAIDIASLFLPRNSLVVITKGRNDKELDRYHTKKDPIAPLNVPIFFIVNNFTASAAEILPGCLQKHADQKQGDKNVGQHVFIVGTKTYGKGNWQEVKPISNDCAIAITKGVYCLPDGSCIQGEGIMPDFCIEAKLPPSQEVLWYNKMHGRESNHKNALKNNHENSTQKTNGKKEEQKKEAEKSWHEKKQELIGSDYMILSTLRLIELFDMAQKSYADKMKTRKGTMELLQKLYTPDDKAALEEIKIEG
ncbi:MAG: S41 family peptidase [Candidatus Babeliales bacterium]